MDNSENDDIYDEDELIMRMKMISIDEWDNNAWDDVGQCVSMDVDDKIDHDLGPGYIGLRKSTSVLIGESSNSGSFGNKRVIGNKLCCKPSTGPTEPKSEPNMSQTSLYCLA